MPSPSDHEYELKKVGCRQDPKDGGWLVTLRVHIEDRDSELVLAQAGTCFSGPLKETGYATMEFQGSRREASDC